MPVRFSKMRDNPLNQPGPLRHRLQQFSRLDPDDIQAFEALLGDVQQAEPGTVIVPAGHAQSHALVVARGWCTRSHLDDDGRRQIINYLRPGELTGIFLGVYPAAEYEVTALTGVSVWRIAAQSLADVFARAPRLALALTWMAARDERLLEQQIVRLGLRDSMERLADLLAELYFRQLAVGADADAAVHLPLTQQDLADTLGLSRVHTNRICQALADTGAVSSDQDGIHILHVQRLQQVAAFDDTYLNGEA